MIDGKLQLKSKVDGEIIITDLAPLSDDELKQMWIDWWLKATALTFSVDINELDIDKTTNIQRILDAIDLSCIPLELTLPGEPVGEIYHDDKLVGYIM